MSPCQFSKEGKNTPEIETKERFKKLQNLRGVSKPIDGGGNKKCHFCLSLSTHLVSLNWTLWIGGFPNNSATWASSYINVKVADVRKWSERVVCRSMLQTGCVPPSLPNPHVEALRPNTAVFRNRTCDRGWDTNPIGLVLFYEDKGTPQPSLCHVKTQQKESQEERLTRTQPCRNLDFALPACRSRKKYTSVV